MKTSLISISIGIIIIVVVAWFALQRDDGSSVVFAPTATPSVRVSPSGLLQIAPSPEASPAVASVATVSITDEKIIPATIIVKTGTKVTFVNNGQALHWIASDPHPVHSGLVGLDTLKGISTGETYSFTFTKAGTFGIHDHLHTQLTGTIIVQ